MDWFGFGFSSRSQLEKTLEVGIASVGHWFRVFIEADQLFGGLSLPQYVVGVVSALRPIFAEKLFGLFPFGQFLCPTAKWSSLRLGWRKVFSEELELFLRRCFF